MTTENNWAKGVYHPKEVDFKVITIPHAKVFKRDNYTCQSCRQRLERDCLSVHHIIPRSEGGTNNLLNLITLCHNCHDIIELAEPPIRHRQEIMYHVINLKVLNSMLMQTEEDGPTEKDWHKWVYGSGRNPNK